MTKPVGLYLHIPFCASKCAYCDFYSVYADEKLKQKYTAALCSRIIDYKERLYCLADTIYIGGGTPTVLNQQQLCSIIATTKTVSSDNPEITVEANPGDELSELLAAVYNIGTGRLSVGVQSGIESELKILSRRHNNDDTLQTIKAAKKCGIENISIDIMLGLPYQTINSLEKTISFVLSQKPKHISAYMLKIEPNTDFGKRNIESLNLPDDNLVADMYLYLIERLNKEGFEQYEISNFAIPGYKSKHNLKYWNCEEYIGLGPSAHSYFKGKRFFFDRNIESFINNAPVIFDSYGGDAKEYVMLRLRLTKGLVFDEYKLKFKKDLPKNFFEVAKKLKDNSYVNFDQKHLSLTPKGFLVSNQIILNLIDQI